MSKRFNSVHLNIHPKIKKYLDTGLYYTENGLLQHQNTPVILKQIAYSNHEFLNVCYQKGGRNEFMVVIYRIDANTNNVVKVTKLNNIKLFDQWHYYLNQPDINPKSFVKDILNIYQHAHYEYIDPVFLNEDIDQLVLKYPPKHQISLNAMYSHALLTFTSDYQYVLQNTGEPGKLGAGLKLLGLSYLYNYQFSVLETLRECNNKNVIQFLQAIEDAKLTFRQKGFDI